MAIVCENLAARPRADDFSEKLIDEIGGNMLWCREFWDFAALDSPATRRVVTRAAANADVFILAFDSEKEFHDDFKSWIEQWGGHLFERTPVLIALFNVSDDRRKALVRNRNFLGTIVDLCGLTFLYTVGESVVEHQSSGKHF
jgi:hypothetical protein